MSDEQEQPTPRDVLNAVLNSQDVLALAVGRIELDLGVVKSDVGTLKSDVAIIKSDLQRVERRVIRIDDRLSVIEDMNVGPMLADHERRITRLEGFAAD